MITLETPNAWSCVITSFACMLETTVEQLVKEVGHDGSEIIWPDNPEPYNRRGFHVQEMTDCCYTRGIMVMPIEARPCLTDGKSLFEVPRDPTRTYKYLQANDGILLGTTKEGARHAVCWHNKEVYDPSSLTKSLDDWSIRTFLVLDS